MPTTRGASPPELCLAVLEAIEQPGLLVSAEDREIVYANSAARQLLGPEAGWSGRPLVEVFDLLGPPDSPESGPWRHESGQLQTYWTGNLKALEGLDGFRLVNLCPVGSVGPACRVGPQYELFFETLLEQLPIVTYVFTADRLPIYVSPRYAEVFELDPRSWYHEPRAWLSRVHSDDRRMVQGALGKEVKGFEYRIVRTDGEIRWLRAFSSHILGQAGSAYLFGFVLDVTEELRTMAELRASEERYRQLVEQSPDMIALHRNGRYVYLNQAGMRLLGVEQLCDFVGLPVLDIVSPEFRDVITARIRALAEHPVNPVMELRMRRLNGETFHADATSASVHFEGQPAVQIVVRETTERQRSTELTRRNQELMNEAQRIANLGHWEVAFDPRVVSWSDQHYRILGYEPQEVEAGLDALLARIHPDDRGHFQQHIDHQGDSEVTVRVVWPSGEVRHVLATKHLITGPSGKRERMIGTLHDITERRQVETQQIEIETLSRMNELKDLFLSTVSHELRTPLTAIKGATYVLGRSSLDSEQQSMVAIVARHTERLGRLVNDVLDLSRLESGKTRFDRRPADLAGFARQVAQDFTAAFAEKGLQVRLELAPACALIDRDAMTQVLVNLLSNAAKFTESGGRIVIRTRAEDGLAWLEVEDTGCGIPPEFHDKLFSKFFQVEQGLTRSPGGTGLGLAICKWIVEEGHQGAIAVDSQPGRGSTFTVTLPLTCGSDGGWGEGA